MDVWFQLIEKIVAIDVCVCVFLFQCPYTNEFKSSRGVYELYADIIL